MLITIISGFGNPIPVAGGMPRSDAFIAGIIFTNGSG
jgi:hypothetical protein